MTNPQFHLMDKTPKKVKITTKIYLKNKAGKYVLQSSTEEIVDYDAIDFAFSPNNITFYKAMGGELTVTRKYYGVLYLPTGAIAIHPQQKGKTTYAFDYSVNEIES